MNRRQVHLHLPASTIGIHASYNVDKLTDHFVTITGRGVDDQGRAYYSFNDPSTRGSLNAA